MADAIDGQVDGRVIIDAFAYYVTNNIVKPVLRPTVDEEDHDSSDTDTASEAGSCSDASSSAIDPVVAGPEMTASKDSDKVPTRTEKLDPLTDEQCLLATPWVRGLDLKTKEWARFQIDSLSPIVWNDAAFDHLVLPGQEKQLAWAFVENKTLANNNFDDFVRDKGEYLSEQSHRAFFLICPSRSRSSSYLFNLVCEQAAVSSFSCSARPVWARPSRPRLVSLSKSLQLFDVTTF